MFLGSPFSPARAGWNARDGWELEAMGASRYSFTQDQRAAAKAGVRRRPHLSFVGLGTRSVFLRDSGGQGRHGRGFTASRSVA